MNGPSDKMASAIKCPRTIRRFWSKVEKSDGCWNWQAYRCEKGYGSFGIPTGKTVRAHRFSLALSCGLPAGARTSALHSCDNPACVNPAHLRWGSDAENMADALASGLIQCGSARRNAKLTEAQALEIFTSDEPSIAMAHKFGVSKTTIHTIRHGKSWRQVTGATPDPEGEDRDGRRVITWDFTHG